MATHSFSLRRRLLMRLLPSILVLYGLDSLGDYFLGSHLSEQGYDSWLYDAAQSLVFVVRHGQQGLTVDLPESTLKLLVWDSQDVTYFKISGSRSGVVAGTAELPPPPPNAVRYNDALMFDAAIAGRPVRALALQLPASAFGEVVEVEVAETTGKRDALERSLIGSTVLRQVVLLFVFGMIIWRAVGQGLKPLLDTARRLEQQDSEKLQPLPDSPVPLEVQPLTRALNDLLARLELSFASQRRFLADSAHQLRTPLTGLKLNIEQAQQETDPQAVQRSLAALRISVDRTVRLANQLLALSRAESDATGVQTEDAVDLCALVREVGSEWVTAALHKNLELSFQAERDRIEVRCSPPLLREAVNNLIDNAVKYHPGNGTVALSVAALPQVSIAIEDDGRGIPDIERELVTARFYRGAQASGNGAGLGLAIVKEIARAHHATLEILPGRSGKGTLVRLGFAGA